jgi:hypothetical protein
MQVEEGFVVATVVEESAAPPTPAAATLVEEERAVEETAAPQAALGPPAGASSGGEDVVMVPAGGGSVPPPPTREHDIAMLAALESSAAAIAASVEGAAGTSSSRYVDFPGIGIIDLDATELPSNDREILEVATERMFVDPSILDAIASVLLVSRQDEGAGSLAPPAAPEAAEGVLEESTASSESVVIETPPTSVGESMDAPLLQPTEAAVDALTPSVVGMIEEVIRGAGPSPSQPAATVTEEDPVPSQPVAAPEECDAPEGAIRAASPQERDTPEGTTRATSLEIQETEENSGVALPQDVENGEAHLELPVPRGRPPSWSAMTPRSTRMPQCARPSSVSWRGRAEHSTS